MSNKFNVVLIFLFGLNIYSITADSIRSDSCSLPRKFKDFYDYDWRLAHDQRNVESPTDYFVLALSWSPTYCASLPDDDREETFQCSQEGSFGLVVHGLWPQTFGARSKEDHPRNCRNEEQLPQSIIRRYFCLMPSENLMQDEWEKHGSCYFSSAVEYFTRIEHLVNQLNIPSIQPTTPWTIVDDFRRSNSQLTSDAISVKVNRNGLLEEIHICYDRDYNFISCRE